jgi:hypothetical protein
MEVPEIRFAKSGDVSGLAVNLAAGVLEKAEDGSWRLYELSN